MVWGPETLCATGKEEGKLLRCKRERSRAVTAHMVVCHQNQCTLSCAGEAAQCLLLVLRNRYGLAPGWEYTDATSERVSGWKTEVNRSHKAQAGILGSNYQKVMCLQGLNLQCQHIPAPFNVLILK